MMALSFFLYLHLKEALSQLCIQSITTVTIMDSYNDIKNVKAPKPQLAKYAPSTRAMHADDFLNETPDVAPAIHVATTFSYDEDPSKLIPKTDVEV